MKKRNHRNGKPKKNHQPIVRREPSFPTLPQRIEDALINGNLATLSPEERVQLYMQTCKSLKLNPMTKPFGYILMKDYGDNEKLILYATRNCTDQLRSVYGASDVPGSLKREQTATELTAEIAVVGRNGRTSYDVGVIPLTRYVRGGGSYLLTDKGKERELANAKMHVVTKARRRATLALYGLGGIVDESELDTMQVVGGVTKEGRLFRYVSAAPPQRELVDGGEYPKGSPRSEVAEATLKRVEALDQEFASGVAVPPLPQGTASKPAQGNLPTTGRQGDAPLSAQAAEAEGGPPRPPQAPISARKPQDERKPEAGSIPRFLQKTVASAAPTSNPVPKARIPHPITAVRWTKNGKGLEVELGTGHRYYTFRDSKMDEKGTKLFDILLNSVGKMAIFTAKLEKGFQHIEKVLQIGEREWLEDGTPVLRREAATKGFNSQVENREPGDEPF